MLTGKMAMDLGKLIWTVSFLLVLFSSPMLVFDLIGIQRSVEVASGADIWYDGQMMVDLLRLQAAVRNIEDDPSHEVLDEVRLRLDNAFNRINSLPEPGSSAWHTQGLGRERGLIAVREQLDAIDQNLKLLDTNPRAFRTVADEELRSAITAQRKVSLLVMDRQQKVVGRLQSQVSVFQIKLLGYGVGFVTLVLALIWLMWRHMHSEAALRTTNEQLLEMTNNLERKVEQRTADLRLARDEANRANQMKTRFLAAASHDLGQPFQAMRLFIDLLDKRLQGSPHCEYLQALQRAHMSGQQMLASLLDLSRLDSGAVQLRMESFPVSDLLDRLAAEFRPLAESRGLRLRIRGCDGEIHSDPVLLHQIVANLLANGLRYTTSGGILLACRHRGTMLRLEVWDTGIGIPADRLEEIFEEFHRIETVEESGFRGVGLGLSIVRRSAGLLNHKVLVCSRLGHGSMFSITVPSHQIPDD